MASEVIRPLAFRSEIVEQWQWHKLEDVCEGIFDCPHSTPLLTDSGPYVARSQDIRTGVFKLDLAGRVSEETYKDRVARAEPRHGDLLFSREGTYFGIAAEVPPNIRVCLGQRMVLIRPDADRLNFRFLRYWLNSQMMVDHMHGFRDGTVAERLNMPTIRRLPVVVPPFPIQEDIATTLGTLDDKIELNRRMNATLEQMAQALFKSWFVDFDPVKAKAEGRAPEGMDADTAALFPSEFEESEQEWIPKGWRVAELSDLLLQRNQRAKVSPQTESIPYVPIECITSKSIFLAESRPGQEAQSSLTLFFEGDILFGAMRPYFHKVCLAPFDGVTRTTAFVLKHRRQEEKAFSLFTLFQDSTIEYATLHSEGSTIPYAKWENSLERMKIILPIPQVRAVFGEKMKGLIEKGNQNVRESKILTELRDALLPRLISGQLRIPDIEQAEGGV